MISDGLTAERTSPPEADEWESKKSFLNLSLNLDPPEATAL
jgi:hypothetical protein